VDRRSLELGVCILKSLLGFMPPGGRDRIEIEFLPAAPGNRRNAALAGRPRARHDDRADLLRRLRLGLLWQDRYRRHRPGRSSPMAETRSSRPLEAGMVKGIFVRDGQAVKAGDVLIELDPRSARRTSPTCARPSRRQARRRAPALLADRGRRPDGHLSDPPMGADPTLLNMQRRLLENQLIEQKSKLAALDRQRAQKEAERITIGAAIEKLDTTIPYIASASRSGSR